MFPEQKKGMITQDLVMRNMNHKQNKQNPCLLPSALIMRTSSSDFIILDENKVTGGHR